MKNYFAIIIAIGALITACGKKSEGDARMAELEKLRAQRTELDAKIKDLEKEMGSAATATGNLRMKNVAVTELKPSSFEHSIDIQGRVDGDEIVNIGAKTAGTVKRVLLKAGDRVRENQVIAELDHDIVDAQIATIKTNWSLANDMYNKQKSLWDQKVGTEMAFLQAKNAKESLEKQMATLQEQLELSLIKSPINGVLDELPIKIGQSIMPGMPCARVVNYGKLKVRAEVSESYASLVKTGNDVYLFFPDINRSLKTTVSYASRSINPLTRTFSIDIQLPSDEDFRPNMVGVIRIVDYRNPEAISVPINTIQNSDGTSHVFVAEKSGSMHVAKKKEVVVGAIYNGRAEILKGLAKGEKLITTGYQDLNENELVAF